MKTEIQPVVTAEELALITAVRFNHKNPSRMSWGEKILGGGGLGVHNCRIEPSIFS
jgi:hypothetical protein